MMAQTSACNRFKPEVQLEIQADWLINWRVIREKKTALHLLESCRTGLLNESLGNENCNTSKISKLG